MTGRPRSTCTPCVATARSLAFMRTNIQPPTHPPQRGNSMGTAEFLVATGKRRRAAGPTVWKHPGTLPRSYHSSWLCAEHTDARDCSSFLLYKRWGVLKRLNRVLQWVSDSSGVRKNSGFFLAHRPVFSSTVFFWLFPFSFHLVSIEQN